MSLLLAVLAHFNTSLGIAPYLLVLSTSVLFWVIQTTSWNILSGYAGYFSFGQAAYVGVGAYSVAVLTGRHGVSYPVSIVVGGLLGALLALITGAIAFRLGSLRGEIFALLTLAVPFILAAFVRINRDIDGGLGTTLPLPSFPDWIGDFQHLIFLLMLAVATLAVGTALAVQGSRFGRGLFAIHDDEDAAEVLGVPTFRYKMIAIVLSGALGGIGGALFAMRIGVRAVGARLHAYRAAVRHRDGVLGGRRHWARPGRRRGVRHRPAGRLAARSSTSGATSSSAPCWSASWSPPRTGLFGRLRVRPWLTLGVFVPVLAGLLLSGQYTELDAILYAMVAAIVVAVGYDRLRPVPAGSVRLRPKSLSPSRTGRR